MNLRWPLLLSLACIAYAAPQAKALHVDVLLQLVDDQLVTGAADFETSSWVLGEQVFSQPFDSALMVQGTFATDAPGFNARGADRPPGSDPLPLGAEVRWDFLPMYVDGARSTLLYWDGSDLNGGGLSADDVRFVQQPGYLLNIEGENTTVSNAIFADGGPNRTLGTVHSTVTSASGFLHQHREFRLLDEPLSEIDPETSPDEGIYLISLELSIDGKTPAEPIFLLFETGEAASGSLEAATAWVDAVVDQLVLEGDYNNDGAVDAADYSVWRNSLGGATGLAADGNGDLAIDHNDYLTWRANYGRVGVQNPLPMGPVANSTAAPEPAAASLLVACLAALASHRRHCTNLI